MKFRPLIALALTLASSMASAVETLPGRPGWYVVHGRNARFQPVNEGQVRRQQITVEDALNEASMPYPVCEIKTETVTADKSSAWEGSKKFTCGRDGVDFGKSVLQNSKLSLHAIAWSICRGDCTTMMYVYRPLPE